MARLFVCDFPIVQILSGLFTLELREFGRGVPAIVTIDSTN